MTAELLSRANEILSAATTLSQLPRDRRSLEQVEDALGQGEKVLADQEDAIRQHRLQVARLAHRPGESPARALAERLELEQRRDELLAALLYLRALAAWRGERPDTAMRLLEEATIVCGPALAADAARLLERFARQRGRPDRAILAVAVRQSLRSRDREKISSEDGLEGILSRMPENVPATYHYGRVQEESGADRDAREIYLAVLSLASDPGDPYAAAAYRGLGRVLDTVESDGELTELAGKLVGNAAAHEADRGEILPEVFRHPALPAEAAVELRNRLLEQVTALVGPSQGTRSTPERDLLQRRAARLGALVRACAASSLEAAEEELGGGAAEGGDRAVSARILHDQWRRRCRTALHPEARFASPAERLGAYRHAAERRIHWLAQAVQAGDTLEPDTTFDMQDLFSLLLEKHHGLTDGPPTAEDLARLVPVEPLRPRLQAAFGPLLRRLERLRHPWHRLPLTTRHLEMIRAVGRGGEVTDFMRDEMLALTHQRTVLRAPHEEKLSARVALAELYSEQRRWDMALEQARAAIALDGDSADGLYWLGLAHMRTEKRLRGLEILREAAQRFGHPVAFAALGDDSAHDDDPHGAAGYYMAAVEHLLRDARHADSRDLDRATEWLAKAAKHNERVTELPYVPDRSRPRRERAELKKRTAEKNAQRMAEKKARDAMARELQRRIKLTRTLVLRA